MHGLTEPLVYTLGDLIRDEYQEPAVLHSSTVHLQHPGFRGEESPGRIHRNSPALGNIGKCSVLLQVQRRLIAAGG